MLRSPSGPRPVVAVRLHKANYELLKSTALEHDVPMASIVRWAIERHLCRWLRDAPNGTMADFRAAYDIPKEKSAL